MNLQVDFSNFKFRCSSLGHLMTEPKEKKNAGELSEGAKTHLLDIYISNKYGVNDDISNKYIEKGLTCEEDSITLYSRVKKQMFKKNTERLFNDYIQGEPDLFTGQCIRLAESIKDIKSSWSIYTFMRTYTKPTNQLYYWQGQGYMYLTGAKTFDLAYCLVSTPDSLIEQEKRKLWYKLGEPEFSSDLCAEAFSELEQSMRFEHIPIKERVLEYHFDRDEDDIKRISAKVQKGREYLQLLQEQLTDKFYGKTIIS